MYIYIVKSFCKIYLKNLNQAKNSLQSNLKTVEEFYLNILIQGFTIYS